MKGVNYLSHAAALKQVPSCEFYPLEAVKSNILGAENVMNAAIANKVERVVVLSTDKAVYPINAMGMSKALMEKVMISNSRTLKGSNTIFCGTRYGNVMASRGSVIPLFINQIKSAKDITITHPKMTRFLMNLNSAVELVMYAFKNAKNGDIFVQKSPSATVENIAKALIELYKSKSKEVRVIGRRHGEKLYQALCSQEEMLVAQDEGEYYRICADNRDLNYEKFFDKGIFY
jgi:UDP-glucose 4-epimerase